VQTIPTMLEEAAAIHGATRWAVIFQIILPIAKQGLVSAGLIAFNMCMGAFTSPLVLGGGRVLTVPVLIQQKIIVDSEYGVGAALSMVLILFVFAVNLSVGAYMLRERKRNRTGSGAR
jgi:putative spermidine/putrescine transport system permease protein